MIGDVGYLSGEWDDTQFDIFVMKEPDYNIMVMSTISGLTVMQVHKKKIRIVNGEVVKFNYPELFPVHQRYSGSVQNNNSLRHDGVNNYQIGLEIAWGTTYCPILFFTFFIYCTEVNVYLGVKYFLKNDDNFISFGKNGYLIIQNSYINDKTCVSQENKPKRKTSHILETTTTHATNYDGKNRFVLKNSDTNNTSTIE